jgi:RHS repeat-associated protein
MAQSRLYVAFSVLAFASLALILPPIPAALSTPVTPEIVGTENNDLIVVGPQGSRILVGTGEDLIIGGAGNNEYLVDAGVGHITVVEVAGQNTVEFGPNISFSDVASGLWRSGDDLQLVLGNENRTLTVSGFFTVKDTIASFTFQNGQQLSSTQLFQVFGTSEPTADGEPLQLVQAGNGDSVISGSSQRDILIPSEDTQVLKGLAGNDYLIGRTSPVTFEIYPGDGQDVVVASSGHHEIFFRGGITFNDVASQLQKRGDDLVLGNRNSDDEVRIYKFFTLANTVVDIRFESGGQLQSAQLFELFGVAAPEAETEYALNVEGILLDAGGSSNGGGDCGNDCSGGGTDPGNGDPGDTDPELPEEFHWLIGTAEDDLIYAGSGDNLIIPEAGDDYVLGGPGNNLYYFEAGFGNNVIVETEGFNVIEFDESITYSDVSQSFVKSGNDLLLRIDSKQVRITVRDFFSVANTLGELRFHDGASLTRSSLFQVFGEEAPSQVQPSRSLVLGAGDSDTLSGSGVSEFLVPRMGVRVVKPGEGSDYLVGRLPGGEVPQYGDDGITFELRPGDGNKVIVADSALNNVYFVGGIERQDIASNMIRWGNDLVLQSESHNVGVRVVNFFSRRNVIGNIFFGDGDGGSQSTLSSQDILGSFGVSPDAESRLNILIKGGSTDSCDAGGVDGSEGFGLTPEQLSETNQPPQVTSAPSSEAWYASEYVYQVRATDNQNDDLCFHVTGPEGVEIDKYAGLLSWQPQRHQLGENYFEIRVVDERGAETLQMFHLTVQDPNKEPAFTSWPLQNTVVGQDYVYSLMASDPFVADSRLAFSLVSGPEGMLLEGDELRWTPNDSQTGDHEISVRVTDPYGLSDTQSFVISVSPLVTLEEVEEGHSRIPRTGARISRYSGDDGDVRVGTDRFFVRDDERDVVVDQVNGLVWQDNSDVVLNEATTFHNAASYCRDLELGGETEWRLPNRLELVYLFDHSKTLIEQVFKYQVGTGYDQRWFFASPQFQGRSREPAYSSWKTMVDFKDTRILPADYNKEASVRCVSGPQRFLPSLHRLDDHNLVVDRANRLMWQDTPEALQVRGNVEASLAYCEALDLGGFSDWRLPNFNESQLLVREFEYFVFDDSRWSPDYFINVPENRHWLSSTLVNDDPTRGYLFRYQYDPESNYAGSWAANANHSVVGLNYENYAPRCIRSYAEPVAVLANMPPQEVNVEQPIVFDGSASYHSDGNITAYEWSNLTTEEVLGDSAVLETQFSNAGTYEIQLTVTDQLGLSQPLDEPISLVVYGPPVIQISGQTSLWEGDTLVLDGSGTEDVVGISAYEWTNATDGSVVATGPLLEMANLTAGENTYRLTVTNARGLEAAQDVTVAVIPRPNIEVEGNPDVNLGDTVTLEAGSQASDPSVESIQWLSQETGEVLGEGSTLVLEGLALGQHRVVLSLTYANGLTHQQSIDVSVSGHSPVISLDGDFLAAVGDSVSISAQASHVPLGEIAAFRWYEGDTQTPFSNSASVTLTGLEAGSWPYRVEVESDAGQVATKTLLVEVGYAPHATLPDAHYVYENVPITLDGSGSSVQEGVLEYEWRLQDEVVSTSAIANLQGMPAGEYPVLLTVTTGLGLTDTAELSLVVEPTRELMSCPLQPVANDKYVELQYPENDIEWRGNQVETVDDIARGFNYARSQDPSVFQFLIMPDQATWDAMSLQDKGLYLVNAERTARGLKPYQGVAQEIVTIAQGYADYIHDRNQVIGHYNDGLSPSDRLDSNAYLASHRDAHVKTESLASGNGYAEVPTVDQALVLAIYGWLYQDKSWFEDFEWATGPAWGHRDHVLQAGLDENSGIESEEGVIGFGVARGLYRPGQTSPSSHGYVTVFQTVDQNSEWDMSGVTTVDVSAAQGCNTAHILEIDESRVDTNGLREIRVAPSTLMMVPGDSHSLQVGAYYDNGNEVDITAYASFVADSRSIISVEGGVLTAEREGNAQVLARVNGLESNRLFVRVREATDLSNLQGTEASAYSEYVPDNATISSYDPMAMAVYTGLVLDRDGQPMAGVQASFLNKPELGSTKTGSDGRFIIAGPAGQQTIVYEKTGHLVVQRTTIGSSNVWASLENVMLLPRDSKQTRIDLTSGEPQVHQSTPVIDEFGERQATVVFNGITTATVVSADGSTRELDEFQFSATEFETPESMPGELPRETAFTFANDLHVAGVYYSDSVVFDSDVVMFVDNFLGFDVGEIVPIGTYDRLGNQWVASSNGVVVQLLDVDGDGVVDGLDYTGDSTPDDLNGNGNTEDEVIGLAGYEAGDTLWWGSFNHFSAKDYNWGSSEDEAPTELALDLEQEDEQNEELECTGSYVKPYQQTFHEDIAIAGTNLTLHYSSQRTEGYKHKARIKVSGAEIPSTLEKMIVKLEVAGRVFQRELAPATNTEVEFIWDGTRVDGVRPAGMVSGRVSIGYEYKTQYISAGNAAEEQRELAEFPVAWATVGNNVTEVPGRQNYISWQTRGVSFKNSFERQLANGWSLSNVHEYDPAGRVYLGSGSVVDVETQSLILKTGLTYSLIDGDDGYYQSGGSSIDYTVNDEGVLVDKVTGLEWQFTDQPFETRTKAGAQAYCANDAMPKGTGWRLPTAKEVGYTLEKSGGNIGPAIYSVSRARGLWHTSAANPESALKPVMCVRGESIDERYTRNLKRDAAKQVVVDNDNGLMWQDAPENASTKLDWASSIQHCEASTFAGFSDWRLPNINELLYVLPNSVFAHQTELVFPPGEYWDYEASFRQPYWSSTTNFRDDEQAWAIESASFNSERFSKTDQYYVRCVRDAASASRMPYRFDSEGRHIATFDLDSGTTLVEFGYNEAGKLNQITDRFGNVIAIERNADGEPQRIVAADGQITELTVDEHNNLTALAYEDGSEYQFLYQDGGLLTEKTDPNGYRYPHEFDQNGRVYQTRDPEGGQWDFFDTRVGIGHNRYGYTTAEGNQYQTVRRVLENGDVRKEITYKNGTTLVDILRADQLQQTTLYGGVTTVVDKVLDPKTLQEIPSAITVSQPSGLTQNTTLSTVYGQNGADTSRYTVTASVNGDTSTTEVDARAGTLVQTSAEGRVVREQVDPETLLTQSISVTGLLDSEFTYDARGRLIQETVGDRSTSYTFGSEGRGQVTAITAADGKQTFYEYDLLGRVTKVTYPDGHTTLSEYDENGNRTTLVVPTPADHDSAYNGINRVTSEATPLGETTQYEYDRDRRLTVIELPSGQRLEHTYSQNRLTRTDTPEGAILYDYHHGDQLSQITEGGESLSYSWDGTLLTAVNYQGELNEGIQYQHNPDYQVSQITYAGDSSSLTYDRDGLLTGIHGFAIGRHADHGLPVSLDDGTLNRTFGYNGHGEVTVVSTELNQAATFDYELTYNKVGQIVGKTETLPDGTVNQYGYEYDDRYRLTEVTKNSQLVEQYQYDANGNRTLATSTERGVSGVSASYNLGDQLQSFGNTSYTYDGNGRLSQKTTGTDVTTYDYDSQGRLKQVQTPDHTIEYRHNALGNRVAKLKDGQVVERYLWQDKTTLLATYDGDGNLKQRFNYTLGHAPTSFTENGETYYLLTDHLGSPRMITDSFGQVVKAIEYDAYGNVISDSNPGFEIPFAFASGLRDPDTGLIRFGYRDYDPTTGRWTARDPIGFAGGDTNLYGYVLNNPLLYTDPSGLAPPQNIPPGVDVAQNIAEAKNMSYGQWYNAVRNGGKWDYKQQGAQYQEFGNYNFGVTARAVGIPGNIPNRGAGWAQGEAGTSLPQWGNWWDWPSSSTSFGDDPADQHWINEGIKDYENGYYDPKVCR